MGRGQVRASAVWKALLIGLVFGLTGAGYLLLTSMDSDLSTGITMMSLATESTATVGLAGVFPVDGDLASPQGISLAGERLYVAESDAGSISVFMLDGALDSEYSVPVPEDGVQPYPSDVAALPDGRIFVVDTANERVVGMDTESAGEAEIVFGASGGDALGQPTAVVAGVVGDSVEVFVADSSAHTINVYAPDGEFLRSIGADLDPALTFVGAMALSPGELYLADSNAGRVLVVDPSDGTLIRVLDTRMRLPRGIALAPDGRVFVCDSFERTVEVFSVDGGRIDVIGAESTVGYESGGSLSAPRGAVWVDDDSRLYVTDTAAGVVRVYNVREAQ